MIGIGLPLAGAFLTAKMAEYCKQALPNYRVFDEKRYFAAGDKTCVFDLDGVPTVLLICKIFGEHPRGKPFKQVQRCCWC
ncbi:MAG: hypothetical protein R3E67_06510 [Pseudomonadales bacterium]